MNQGVRLLFVCNLSASAFCLHGFEGFLKGFLGVLLDFLGVVGVDFVGHLDALVAEATGHAFEGGAGFDEYGGVGVSEGVSIEIVLLEGLHEGGAAEGLAGGAGADHVAAMGIGAGGSL